MVFLNNAGMGKSQDSNSAGIRPKRFFNRNVKHTGICQRRERVKSFIT